MWNSITITNQGEKLLSEMINGSKLTFTRAAIGSGMVSDNELAEQTDISEPINAPALISGKRKAKSGNGVVIRLQIRNDGVIEETRMRQVGLFAQTDHHEEILFGILQNEIGEEIPPYSVFSQLLYEFDVTVVIGRTNNISVVVSPEVFPSREEFETLQNQIAELGEKVGSNIEVSSNEVPAVGVKTHYYIIKSVPGYTPYGSETETSNIHDGVLDTDNGTVQGYVQDEAIHPIAILSE